MLANKQTDITSKTPSNIFNPEEKKENEKHTLIEQASSEGKISVEKISQDLHDKENVYAELLVEQCIVGNLKAVKEIIVQGALINKPNKQGISPLLGAYWGLKRDIIQYLDTCNVAGMTYEKADQELQHMGMFNVVKEFTSIKCYEQWYTWMCRVEKELYSAKGVVESYTNIADEKDSAETAWIRQKIRPSIYKILYISESNHLQYEERKQRLTERLTECQQLMNGIAQKQKDQSGTLTAACSTTATGDKPVSTTNIFISSSSHSLMSGGLFHSSSASSSMQSTAIATSQNLESNINTDGKKLVSGMNIT
jgi:hypothetical protein